MPATLGCGIATLTELQLGASTMYFGLKLHTENLIIIPHGMPWGIIVLILMTPALPCLLLPLIKFTKHGIKIHILRNFNPHFTEKACF